jgi:hypothetical protein
VNCPTCGQPVPLAQAPPEPPLGTWVRDAKGGVSVRIIDADGNDGWAAAPTGFYAFAKWPSMWEARGPLVVCGPWGRAA